MGRKTTHRPHVHESLTLREAAVAAKGMTTAEALAAGVLCDGETAPESAPHGASRCRDCGAEVTAL